jgi:uncharacterized membrane protein
MEINGLPLHPLVVHAAVVFGPLAALLAIAYVALPARRTQLRWPMLVLALIATGAILLAYFSGQDLLSHRPELKASPAVQTHQERGRQLLWVTIAFGVVALVAAWLSARTGALRVVLDALLVLGAVAVLLLVIRSGDSGARAVWG